MDIQLAGRQMIEINRAMFDNYFNAMCILQDRVEQAVEQAMAQSPLFPGEMRSIVADWFGICKQGRSRFKALADDCFRKMEEPYPGETAGKE